MHVKKSLIFAFEAEVIKFHFSIILHEMPVSQETMDYGLYLSFAVMVRYRTSVKWRDFGTNLDPFLIHDFGISQKVPIFSKTYSHFFICGIILNMKDSSEATFYAEWYFQLKLEVWRFDFMMKCNEWM